jgi:hypothetical protein
MAMCFEFDRGQVLEARMPPDVVVVKTPGFDYDLGFDMTTEPFDRNAARKHATSTGHHSHFKHSCRRAGTVSAFPANTRTSRPWPSC